MATIPSALQENQDSSVVLARMKADQNLVGVDTAPNTPVHLALAPVSVVVAELYRQLEGVLYRSRLAGNEGEVATGADLDAIGETRGQLRLPGARSTGFVRLSGPVGATIDVSTAATTLGTAPLRFSLSASATIPAGGLVDVPATAVAVGADYNVPSLAIQLLDPPVAGVSVLNPNAFSGGVDVQSDDDYRARLLDLLRNPPNGSNKAQYRKWASDVVGVGGSSVLRPGEANGPTVGGNVDLYLIDTQKLPASQVLIDTVQDYIAPARSVTVEAEVLSIFNANGVTTVDRADDTGTSKALAYSASGNGELRDTNFHTRLIQPGEWDARPSLLVSSVTPTANLLVVEIYSLSNAQIARASAGAAFGTATYTIHASDLLTVFSRKVCPFYWDGIETLELRIRRQAADTTTTVYVDNVIYRSHFSSYDLEGLAPALDQVNVKSAIGVPVNVVADVHLLPGYVFTGASGVQAAIGAALTKYLQEIAFDPSTKFVIYGEVGAVIQQTPGVDYYDPATLRVNAGTVNIALDKRQVPTPGVYTISNI